MHNQLADNTRNLLPTIYIHTNQSYKYSTPKQHAAQFGALQDAFCGNKIQIHQHRSGQNVTHTIFCCSDGHKVQQPMLKCKIINSTSCNRTS